MFLGLFAEWADWVAIFSKKKKKVWNIIKDFTSKHNTSEWLKLFAQETEVKRNKIKAAVDDSCWLIEAAEQNRDDCHWISKTVTLEFKSRWLFDRLLFTKYLSNKICADLLQSHLIFQLRMACATERSHIGMCTSLLWIWNCQKCSLTSLWKKRRGHFLTSIYEITNLKLISWIVWMASAKIRWKDRERFLKLLVRWFNLLHSKTLTGESWLDEKDWHLGSNFKAEP